MLGGSGSASRNVSPNFSVLWKPVHWSSMRASMPGTHHAPSSVTANRRSGKRTNTPPQISDHSGRAAKNQASVE